MSFVCFRRDAGYSRPHLLKRLGLRDPAAYAVISAIVNAFGGLTIESIDTVFSAISANWALF